jgi:hypothetical protein
MSTDVLNIPFATSSTLFFETTHLMTPTPKRVRFSTFSSLLDEQDNICFSRTKEHDGTLNEIKRSLALFANAFYTFQLSSNQKSLEFIEKLIESDSVDTQLQFVSYCKDQVNLVIKKFNEQQEIEKLEKIEKVEEEYEKDIYWSNVAFDNAAAKKRKVGVSLILEPSRDMLNMRFGISSSDLTHINAFLKYLENLEEKLFFALL